MATTRDEHLALGEWACLGALAQQRAHGFAVARRLAPGGDLGRVWTLSRPLTYRAVGALLERGLVREVGEEPGATGPPRTILAPTARGRAALRRWLAEPVTHLRDVRSELLLKIVLCDLLGVDRGPLLAAQAAHARELADRLRRAPGTRAGDPVALWRAEASLAVVRFLDRLRAGAP